MKHLVLIGPRCSGKTSVGRLVAEQLGRAFIDIDERVVATSGRSIATLFKVEGEKRFRDREEVALATALGRPPCVIATGGGVVVRESNRQRMKHATVVLLRADDATLLARMKDDPATPGARPELPAGNAAQDRMPHYEQLADATFDTSKQSVEDVAREVLAWVWGEQDKSPA